MAIVKNDYEYSGGVHRDDQLGGTTISGSYHVITGIQYGTIRGENRYYTKTTVEEAQNTRLEIAVFQNSGAYVAGSSSFTTISENVILNISGAFPISILSSSYDALEKQTVTYTASVHTLPIDLHKIK
tara:strand:+ start:116 stop:499 length:384 start_codon:yes stop_codon:yes gene_type:complete